MSIEDDSNVNADIIKEEEQVDMALMEKYEQIIESKQYLQVNIKRSKIDLHTQSVIKIMAMSEEIIEEQLLFTIYDPGKLEQINHPIANIERMIAGEEDKPEMKENLIEGDKKKDNSLKSRSMSLRSTSSGNSKKYF
ncbi:MAG: hypothetical protein MJ252_15230 [archaeon]|nr:hypothetical protein [archaeon]